MNDLIGIFLAVALLMGNAFFVGSEFALISARRDRLEALSEQGRTRALAVLKANENLTLMLAGAQLGITICSILLGRIAEPAIAHLLEVPFASIGVPKSLLHPVAFSLALTLVVILHVLVGEMVPKNIALAGPESTAMLLIPSYLFYIKLIKPLIATYNFAANLVLLLVRIEPKDELDTTVSTVQLTAMLGESLDEGLLDPEEHRRLTQTLTTTEKTVADVLIPLDKVHSLPAFAPGLGPTLNSIEQAVVHTGFSRYPVQDASGNFTGYLHLKDILNQVLDENLGPHTLIDTAKIRQLPPINETTTLEEALSIFRRSNSHLGTVIDSRGQITGMVALEDLLEEFIGTVRDGTHQI
ncbi:MAG: hemolysin family protein [Mycobacteriaceae bacterium]